MVTYAQGIKLHLNDDTLNVLFLGGGHTDGDSVVIREEANVVHMGNLYFKIPGFPFIDVRSGGSVYNATRSLDLVIAMMGEAVKRVDALREEGKTLEEAIAAKPLAGFDRGQGFISEDGFVTAFWGSRGS